MRYGYLLDTNHLGLAVSPLSGVRLRLRSLRSAGVRIGTIVPVLCELQVGVQYVRAADEYQDNLRRLLGDVRVWPLDLATAQIYGRIAARLKQRGRTISAVDMMLASLAEQMNPVLVSTDSDFDALPHIPREDWTKP